MQSYNASRSPMMASPSSSTPKSVQPTRCIRARNTPNQRKSQSASPPGASFASSQFTHSPSARSLPLPPPQWISNGSRSSSDEKLPLPMPSDARISMLNARQNEHVVGVRVCPLQLIAAVAST